MWFGLDRVFEFKDEDLNLDRFSYFSALPFFKGDWGKCVLVYDLKHFSFIFYGAKRSFIDENPIPSQDEKVLSDFYRDSQKIKGESILGLHPSLFPNYRNEFMGIGGGFYAVLNDGSFFIDGTSRAFGHMHLEILESCLKPSFDLNPNLEMRVVTLNNNSFSILDKEEYIKRTIGYYLNDSIFNF